MQLKELTGDLSWARLVVAPGWLVLVTLYWIGFSSAVIVLAASLSPALAERRLARGSAA